MLSLVINIYFRAVWHIFHPAYFNASIEDSPYILGIIYIIFSEPRAQQCCYCNKYLCTILCIKSRERVAIKVSMPRILSPPALGLNPSSRRRCSLKERILARSTYNVCHCRCCCSHRVASADGLKRAIKRYRARATQTSAHKSKSNG